MTLKRHQLEYVPGRSRPSDMTDSEIQREINDAATTGERRAQLLGHKAWLREFRSKPVDEQTDIREVLPDQLRAKSSQSGTTLKTS